MAAALVPPVRGQKKLGSALIFRFRLLSKKPSTSAVLVAALRCLGGRMACMTVIAPCCEAA